jgi:hypothetical protein
MFTFHFDINKNKIAELPSGLIIINKTEEMLDVIAEASINDCNKIIIHSDSLNPDFFDLKTGLAGEMLQKFSNYRMKLSVIGDFTQLKSKSLNDFIRESNKGGVITFKSSVSDAIK